MKIMLDEELTKLIEYFEDYDENTIEEREAAERDREFYDNKQWTPDETEVLNRRKQPVVTFNLVKRTVDSILGMERLNRTDPIAYPRTPIHESDAEAVTDALRYVADNNDFDQTASDGFFNLLIEGTEAIDVSVVERKDDFEIKLTAIEWDRYFYDIHSRKRDFSDKKYHGITIWMDLDDAIEKWPDAKEVLEAAFHADSSFDDTFEDAPRTLWVSKDQNRKRLRVNQIYYKKQGEWWVAFYTHSGFVVDPEKSQYLDENGDPDDTIVSASAFIDRDGFRYGYVRQLISPQQEVNKRRSKALHHISQRQTFGNKRSGIDPTTVKQELAKPDGHIAMDNGEFGKDFGLIPTQDMALGNFQLLQEAKDMFNTVGTNTSVTGTEDRVRSGRAEQFRQTAGARELTPILDIHNNVKRRVYRKIWSRIKQYWTNERWVRVTDDARNMKWVGLNKRLTLQDEIERDMGEVPQDMIGDPRLAQFTGNVANPVSKLDMDIIIQETLDYANIQQEQFQLITQMYQANPNAIPFESVIELSQLRDKKKILDTIKGNKEAQEGAARAQEAELQLQTQERTAKIEKDLASADKDDAHATKLRAETFGPSPPENG